MAMKGNTPAERAISQMSSSIPPAGDNSVAVIIVNYFTGAHLDECLNALARQTLRPDAVLVVNNGDQLNALDFIETEHPAIKVIESSNIGFAAANNLALRLLAEYTWIALLNPDAFPEPDWLEKLMASVEHNPQADCFSSQLLQAPAPELLDGQGDCYHVSGLAWRSQHGRKSSLSLAEHEVFSACAAAALFRRRALIDVGGFDERYFCYFEDVDLGFRLRLRGFRCVHVPTAVVRHIGSVSSGGVQSDFALYHGHRNLVWTFVKNMPGWWFWLLLPVHILLNLIEIIWFTCKGRGKVICRAKRDALRVLPDIWNQRQLVQKKRIAASWTIMKHMSFWPLTLNR
jgi:GT2 family glycosyltransferase